MSVALAEDAAAVLGELVSSLDNLPSEVQHLLQEIAFKEDRMQELRHRNNQRDSSIQKHARPQHQGGSGLLSVNPKEESQVAKIRSVCDGLHQCRIC